MIEAPDLRWKPPQVFFSGDVVSRLRGYAGLGKMFVFQLRGYAGMK